MLLHMILINKRPMDRLQNQKDIKPAQLSTACQEEVLLIGDIDEAPQFMRLTPQLVSGYRINFDSFGKNLKSLFMVHNETVNIWLHLIPALVALTVVLCLYFTPNHGVIGTVSSHAEKVRTELAADAQTTVQMEQNFISSMQQAYLRQCVGTGYLSALSQVMKSIEDWVFYKPDPSTTSTTTQVQKWPIFVYLISAALCLLGSATFHTFYPISGTAYRFLTRLDICGISLLFGGITFPILHYNFYCSRPTAYFYMTTIAVMAVGCFLLCLTDWFHRTENFVKRAFIFMLCGVSFIIPMTHIVINQIFFDNFGDSFRGTSSMPLYLVAFTSFTGGSVVLMKKCPERNNPRKYDICGQSHQIWHAAAVVGIVFVLMGILEDYKTRTMSVCPA